MHLDIEAEESKVAGHDTGHITALPATGDRNWPILTTLARRTLRLATTFDLTLYFVNTVCWPGYGDGIVCMNVQPYLRLTKVRLEGGGGSRWLLISLHLRAMKGQIPE